MDPHVLRYNTALVGVDVFRATRRDGSPIVDVEIVARFGSAPHRYVATTAIVYPSRAARHLAGPLSLARGGEDTWHLEACKLCDAFPRTSFLLINVPASVGDSWTYRERE